MNSLRIADPAELGARVRELRRQHGLTQPDLALSAGTSIPFIVDLERGKATVRFGLVIKVLEALGAHLELVDGAGDI